MCKNTHTTFKKYKHISKYKYKHIFKTRFNTDVILIFKYAKCIFAFTVSKKDLI